MEVHLYKHKNVTGAILYGHALLARQTRHANAHKNKQILQSEVTGSSGQSYAVAKQPGDSSKEPLRGRFPRLCEGIHLLACVCVCVRAQMCVRMIVSVCL